MFSVFIHTLAMQKVDLPDFFAVVWTLNTERCIIQVSTPPLHMPGGCRTGNLTQKTRASAEEVAPHFSNLRSTYFNWAPEGPSEEEARSSIMGRFFKFLFFAGVLGVFGNF
mmetsp:Transcript_77068/g.249485  ORF Transcript_77068/g.249485 Transcript_77068/m.249485 type:complete len:111 (+) Transcript_77068:594-926(+)